MCVWGPGSIWAKDAPGNSAAPVEVGKTGRLLNSGLCGFFAVTDPRLSESKPVLKIYVFSRISVIEDRNPLCFLFGSSCQGSVPFLVHPKAIVIPLDKMGSANDTYSQLKRACTHVS